MTEIKPTNCHFCGYCCAFLATVEDGRVVDLKPDPSRYPYDDRILAGCRRWRMNLDVLDSPRRVNYPLRRKGERGSGEWERVSWDEALDDIASRLKALAAEHGTGTLASAIGGPHASFWPLHRFMSLFGSPNNMGIGQICWNPRIWMDVITFGWTVEADIVPGITETVFIWGTNPAQSDNSAFWQTIRSLGKSGISLVCVDPRYTQVAALADVWLAPRPGTDCTLALGLVHVIIRDGLVDQAFVDEWCHGFDELAEHVKPFTPEYVGEFCGVEPADIEKAAHLFGEARASALISGRGIDQVGESVAPTHRAICCLRAITGNVDRPGSCVLAEASDFTSEVEFEMSDSLTPEQRALCLNTPFTPLQCFEGYDMVREQTEKLGRRLPMRYMTSASPDRVLHAMETGEPYAVRALIVNATNPLLTYADTNRVYKALMGLDLVVVLDYYVTSTGALADYVLPVAGAIERPIFQIHGGVANNGYGGPAAVKPYYERKTDYEIFRELGLRLGQAEAWPDETLEDAFARQLAPTGWSWDAYCTIGIYWQRPPYEKHLLPGPDGAPPGFATTTGKIELASELLPRLGGQRLPEQGALTSLCSPTLVEAANQRGAHHIPMITGSRKQPYNASMYMDNPRFRKASPRPVAEVSEATAARLGLAAGDTVKLSTDYGEARFTLAVAKMCDDLISVDYGWWHPEQGVPSAPDFGGIWESNVNTLTSCEMREPLIGTWAYNAIDCIVEKTGEHLSWDDVQYSSSTEPVRKGKPMTEKKHALLIFSKPPLPGIVKTRMTTEYGGFLTLEQAATFYKLCFYDVCELGMHALIELQRDNDELVKNDPNATKITYDFFVSTTPADSLEDVKKVFDEIGPWPMEIHYMVDTGHTFDEHFNDACNQLFDLGYESFIAIGGDVPTMPKHHIKKGFEWLDYFQAIDKPGFVYAPCQECGTSLVGYSYNTPINHDGVYYNMDGRPALDGYLEKLQEADIPSAYFDPVADIDEVTDLAHAISCMKAIREAAKYQTHLFVPNRVLNWVEFMGIRPITPPNDNHDPRDYLDGEGEKPVSAGEEQGLTIEEQQRIAKGMTAIREAQARENAYESSKYN